MGRQVSCGKTTYLAEQARNAVEKFGSDRVAICSFTRAAAIEIASRNTGVERSHVGTLHSLCYQAMGCPDLAETHIKEWNAQAGANWKLETVDDADPYADANSSSGDRVFRRYQLLRAACHPTNQYPLDVISFARAWDEWKCANSLVDFTDLIDFGRRELTYAPGLPKALFVDEAQDLNPMQLQLIEKWSEGTQWTIMCGDPDQSIYTFAGADPYAFHNAPAEQKFHPASLRRSWRLPRAVHAWSVDWIRQIKERDDIVFDPREAEGQVIKLPPAAEWREPETLIRAARPYLEASKRVGILATCGYMLDPLKHQLRSEGIPFHNPWRETRGDWNPLTKLSERLSTFLRPCRAVWGNQADVWTGTMLHRWADTVHVAGVFRKGAKAQIKREFKDISRPLYTELFTLFEPGVLEEILRRADESSKAACDWLLTHAINDAMRDRLTYPVRCLEKSGPRALFDEPKVVIGTGHSVKGADKLDVVILLPDLSGEGDRNWRQGGRSKDSVVRLIYVMATRARESLLLARSSGELGVWN